MEANNMAAMRKTLEEMAADLEDLASRDAIRAPAYSSIFSIYAEKCRKSLSAPARNCDVGTAEEQSARMRKFCAKNGLCCDGAYRCENCGLLYDPNCDLTWSQMPYKEGGAK